MLPGLYTRMILMDLMKIFLVSLLVITGIMLMGGVVSEATQQGLGLAQILVVIPLLIPSMMPWTIPATTLFATCLVYGRLTADNEVLALRAAGINLLRVIWPGVILGLAISAAAMGLSYRLIPYTHHLLRTLPLKNAQEFLYAMLKKDRGIDNPRSEFSLFVPQLQGNKLIQPIFKQRDKTTNKHLMTIYAEEATLDVDLKNRKLIVRMRKAEVVHQNGAGGVFRDEHQVEVDLSAVFTFQRQPRPREMSWEELEEYRTNMLKAIQTTEDRIQEAREGRTPARDPADLPPHIEALTNQRRYYEGEIRQVDAEYHLRPALSLACLCFVLIGGPVGIWFGRGDYLSAFMSCFLPIVFIYYPLLFAGTNLAKDGKIRPEISVWAADGLVAFVGLAFFLRLVRR